MTEKAIKVSSDDVSYIFMRTDLDMSVGKMVAQAAHVPNHNLPVVVLKSNNYVALSQTLDGISNWAKIHVVRDAGRTEVEPGTITCVNVIAPRGSFSSWELL